VKITRRFAIGLGTAAAAGGVLGAGTAAAAPAAAPDRTTRRLAATYAREVARAEGTWSSLISVGPDVVVEQDADKVVNAQSVNKIAVATAVLDKIDRGLLTLDQRVDVTSTIVIQDTDGVFALDRAYPSSVTLGHVMSTLLTVSDNTSVRLCGLVCPAAELNEILRAKGFVHTQVVPVQNPNRFFLGTTTPRETHTLLTKLVSGQLLSPTSTDFLLNVLRATSAFNDGVRLNLTTPERLRVATKAGWFSEDRHEAGLMFDSAGAAVATYAMFATGPYSGDDAVNTTDFAATHPALRARQVIGRALFEIADAAPAPVSTRVHRTPAYRPSNGG
jgi:beta-lactamase class A